MPHEKRIGSCTCPICSSRKAEVRVSAKQLAYLVCNACNFQGFARSEQSDRLMRDRITPDSEAGPGPEPKPAPAAPAKPPASATSTWQAPAPKPFTWGAFPS
jgi:hypothetical protein